MISFFCKKNETKQYKKNPHQKQKTIKLKKQKKTKKKNGQFPLVLLCS